MVLGAQPADHGKDMKYMDASTGAIRKILVIEDERELIDLLTLHLTAEGYKVDAAADGEAGLRAFQAGQYGMVLPNFVQSALLGKPISVYGEGTQSRSFTHVNDVVGAITKLMDEPSAEGDIFNVGNNNEVTINELALTVKKMTDSDSEIEHVPYEKAYGPGFEDMQRRCPSIKKNKQADPEKPNR